MSKKEKSIVTNLQTAVTTSTKHQTSSFSQSANEKTEDDVGDLMGMSLICDECKKLLGGLSSLDILECGHHFCVTCIVTQKKEEHVSCGSSVKRSDIFKGDADTNSGSVQHADHDGELSAERKVSGGKSEEMANKSYNKSSRKKKSKTQVFAFLYHKRPVVVSMSTGAPFSELLNRLYMLTNVNRGTHELVLKAQKSSSEEAEAELSTRGPDTVVLDIPNHSTQLRDLKLPRQKMMILESRRKSATKRERKTEQPKREEEKKVKHDEPSPLLSPNNSQGPTSG